MDLIYEEFKESLVLVRMFLTIFYEELPEFNRKIVVNLAEEKGIASELQDDTPVLSLIGTRGENPEWDDRKKSKGHLEIPLISVKFIDSVPMLSPYVKRFRIEVRLVKKS